jgi:hypothetical protein
MSARTVVLAVGALILGYLLFFTLFVLSCGTDTGTG